MYAPQPPSQPEPKWPRPLTPNSIPPPPSYLPQPVPPQAREMRAERSARQWLRIPLDRVIITPVLLVILGAIFVPMALSSDINDLFLEWGANLHIRVMDGQWWRLVTATFLHGGLLHILLNGYALYVIGMDLEGLVGKARFAAIY